MFSLVSGLYDTYLTPPHVKVLLIGVSGSGKTTVLERIKVTDLSTATLSGGDRPPTSPEALRSSNLFTTHPTPPDLFVSPPPPRSRSCTPQQQQQHQQQHYYHKPKSTFAWICPPPPHQLLQYATARPSAPNRSMSDSAPGTAAAAAPPYPRSSTTSVTELAHVQQRQQQHYKRKEVNSTATGTRGVAGLPPPRRVHTMDRSRGHAGGVQEQEDHHHHHEEDQHPILQQEDHHHHHDDTTTTTQPLYYEFDLRPHATMLPLHKIRPTIGMNLAKLDRVCGAKLDVWDLGGRLQTLWERYYADADCVMFCWQLRNPADDTTSDDDDNDDTPFIPQPQQMAALQTVRAAVPPDVPFLILGHLFQTNPPHNCEPDILHSATAVLQSTAYYANTGLFFANAVTGQGIKTAVEWLVSTALQRQRQLAVANANAMV